MHENIVYGQIDEWMWRKIIEKMYDPHDFEILEALFQEMLENKRQSKEYRNQDGYLRGNGAAIGPGAGQKKLTREELMSRVTNGAVNEKLSYVEFQKAILDFQLSEHEKFLQDFTQLFKQVDADHNGILNEDQLRELLSCMRVLQRDDELLVLLHMIDPYDNQKMTFSEVVHLLSSHMVPNT